MTWVALGSLAVLALGLYSCVMLVRGMVRQQARERELLLNQIMHLAGRTWQPPPMPEPLGLDDEELMLVDPSQLPEY